jgi:hypothetical protein
LRNGHSNAPKKEPHGVPEPDWRRVLAGAKERLEEAKAARREAERARERAQREIEQLEPQRHRALQACLKRAERAALARTEAEQVKDQATSELASALRDARQLGHPMKDLAAIAGLSRQSTHELLRRTNT